MKKEIFARVIFPALEMSPDSVVLKVKVYMPNDNDTAFYHGSSCIPKTTKPCLVVDFYKPFHFRDFMEFMYGHLRIKNMVFLSLNTGTGNDGLAYELDTDLNIKVMRRTIENLSLQAAPFVVKNEERLKILGFLDINGLGQDLIKRFKDVPQKIANTLGLDEPEIAAAKISIFRL